MTKNKWYAVAEGRKLGLFETWTECSKQVEGFSSPKFKVFKTKQGAINFLRENCKTPLSELGIQEESKKRKVDEIGEVEKQSDHKEWIIVHTDGGCSDNGSEKAIGGIGVYFENKEYMDLSERFKGKQTNNRAEVTAIIRALEVIDPNKNVKIHTDSEWSINCINGIWNFKCNGDLIIQACELISNRKKNGSLTELIKVDGHSGAKDGNYYADLLATKAIRGE